ncbi:hypothetical protein PFTANZ_06136, partial [Plasmodium falciparum Tanzania (2000708)]
ELKDKLNSKYDNDPDYKLLRYDWWEANRDQVWKAMQCPKNGVHITCDSGVPVDDYIPQRLRWMTEWAEWYCKAQKEAYDKLKKDCIGCTGKDRDCNKSGKCAKCKPACDKYKGFIETWQPQWNKMEQKYDELYKNAEKYNDNGSQNTKNKEDYVLKFLNKLQKANGVIPTASTSARPKRESTSSKVAKSDVYGTAARYVHQELPNMGCKEQIRFCTNPNGELTTSGKDSDKEYAFREYPHNYKD